MKIKIFVYIIRNRKGLTILSNIHLKTIKNGNQSFEYGMIVWMDSLVFVFKGLYSFRVVCVCEIPDDVIF